MRRIGIFSGTFDPVHQGHVAFCQAAIEHAKLDKVVLLPEAEPRDKTGVTPLAKRHTMLELALETLPKLEVLSLPSRQFSVEDTLPKLRKHFPKEALALLVGSDVARTFTFRWPGLRQLLEEMEVIVGLRQQDSSSRIDETMQQLEKIYKLSVRYRCVPSPQAHATSKTVRSGQHDQLDLDPKVANYIAKHRLYDAY
jgi:nicotinate (nicotinamide) nucleotide adenylyltransferase